MDDVTTEEQPADRRRAIGCVTCLAGVLVFVLGCFLPFYDIAILGPGQSSASLYRLTTSTPGTTLGHLGGALYLFAGAAIVAAIALGGMRRARPATPSELTAATAVWALTWLGALIGQADFGPLEVGFWTMLAGVLIAVAGTVAVWVSSRGVVRADSVPAAAGP